MSEYDLNNITIFFSAILAALCYCYFISSKLPAGIYRLISFTPVFYLFTILPLLLSSASAFATAVAAFFFTWLTNFKLILFAFDHEPLFPKKSLIQFIAIASLPAKIKSKTPNQSVTAKIESDLFKSNKKLLVIVLIESLVFPLLISLVYDHKHKLNQHIVLIIYCLLVFLLVDLLVFVSNAVIRTVVGVELEPPSDEPYLSTSLQDFWGRRWNLMVTNILRHTIFKPVKLFFSGKDWDWIPAVLVTFTVSGLMHEMLFYYVTGVNPTWEMTSFFVLHGVCVVVELLLKRALAGMLEFPVVVSRLLTVGFVVVTSFWLFFPPLIKSGADVKVLDEFKLFAGYVKMKFKL